MKHVSLFFKVLLPAVLIFIASCTKEDAVQPEQKLNANTSLEKKAVTDFAYGADVGWLSLFESWGVKYQNDNGVNTDCLQILKDKGVTSIRLRVMVNPRADGKDEEGWYQGFVDPTSVVNMAVRAKNMGFRIMIDFHYSDQWTDPGRQTTPAAWANHNISQLVTDVYNHTYSVMTSLKNAGVTPEWVQVGNEINPGLCLPVGASSDMTKTSRLLISGYNAVKAVSASSLVVIHLANPHDNGVFRWFFDAYKANGGKWDVIGMSAYPAYGTTLSSLVYNLNDMAARYGKYVMVVETGYSESDVQGSYNSLLNTINAVKNVPNGKGIGAFYWEPDGHSSLTSYSLGASTWVSNNVFQISWAMNAFRDAAGYTASVWPNTSSTYKVINAQSGSALNVTSGSRSASATLQQWPYGGWSSQRWTLEDVGSGYYKIKNVNSKLYATVAGSSTWANAWVIQSASSTDWSQQWSLVDAGNGKFKIKNRNSGLLMGTSGGSSADAAQIVQDADAGSYQLWSFTAL